MKARSSPSIPNGSGFTNLHSFTAATFSAALNGYTNSDGAMPYASLLISGNAMYGTTTGGGSNGTGTVFQMNTDGTGFTAFYKFLGPHLFYKS